MEELHLHQVWFDSQKRATREATEASTHLRLELESTRKAIDQMRESQTQLDAELHNERRRAMLLSEERDSLKRKLDRFKNSKSGGAPEVEELEIQLSEARVCRHFFFFCIFFHPLFADPCIRIVAARALLGVPRKDEECRHNALLSCFLP